MGKKTETKKYILPEDRYRFGGLMGKVEKTVVKHLGGPTKALAYLVRFYLDNKDLAEREELRRSEAVKRLR